MLKTEEGPSSLAKKLGVTHAIRAKLNFLDERLWKRFSARRLELIDTLDLSSRKASEQEQEIKRVADSLRLEFNYGKEYGQDFDKLVRAAIQSVRRNRKRSNKSKRSATTAGGDHKRIKTDSEDNSTFLSEIAHVDPNEVYDVNYSRTKSRTSDDQAKETIDSMVTPRIITGNTNNNHHMMISGAMLPPIANLTMNEEVVNIPSCQAAKQNLLNKIERSKTCNESAVLKKSDNIQFLGKSIMNCCIAYLFEKSFSKINEGSIEYLRNKLTTESSLAKFFRELDPKEALLNNTISDEVALITLYTLIGGCVNDFGFEQILLLLCEIMYVSVLQEYPLIVKHCIPFKSEYYLQNSTSNGAVPSNSLNSLAEVAAADVHNTHSHLAPNPNIPSGRSSAIQNLSPTPSSTGIPPIRSISPEMHQHHQLHLQQPPAQAPQPTQPTPQSHIQNNLAPRPQTLPRPLSRDADRKRVFIHFLNQVLEFTYPIRNSAPPRYNELIENARIAFKLPSSSDSMLGLRNRQDRAIIQTDFELERIFRGDDPIEMEIFTQRTKAIPIYELTSTVISNGSIDSVVNRGNTESPKIILPPPLNRHGYGNTSEFNFISNSDDMNRITSPPPPPPQPILPKFQPLL
ncbi:Transcription factor VHR2 [Spathaspora sp. JA1]|nr:Transcription factor VHR2 [Spathaspora sp. JA1]